MSQMMGYEEIMNSWQLISSNAAKTLHVTDHYGIEAGKPANFIVLDAKNYYEALSNDARVLSSWRGGTKIAESQPAETHLYF
jgi:cytosine deaminase